jgi:putative transposase
MEQWPHAPLHWFKGPGHYILTGGTYLKEHVFRSEAELDFLQASLFEFMQFADVKLHAWCFFPNHYHAVVQTENPSLLRESIRKLHSKTAVDINKQQRRPGRKVWFNYWDTFLDDERAYYSRVRYVTENAVHHGIVSTAAAYRWCSARWMIANSSKTYLETLRQFRSETVHVRDDF